MKTKIVVPERLGTSQTIDARREPSDGSYTLTLADAEIVMTNRHALRLLEAMAREEAVARARGEMSDGLNFAAERQQP